MKKQELYVIHRLDGHGARESARRAGFEHGVPSQGARRLWRAAQLARMSGGCKDALIDAKIRDHRRRLAEARALKRACDLIEARIPADPKGVATG